MQPVNETARPQAAPGRWIWRVVGLLTLTVLAALTTVTVTRASEPVQTYEIISPAPVSTLTIRQPVTDLHVDSYGAPIRVTAEPGHGPVRVTESVSYNTAGPMPAVTDAVTSGVLTLSAPACASQQDVNGAGCNVGFSVVVPAGVSVTAAASGGAVTVTGAAAADIDSGGGPVYVADVSGPLSAAAEGGQVTVSGVAGSAVVDSGGGDVAATGISGKLTVRTEGGQVTATSAGATRIDSGGGPVSATTIRGPLDVMTEGGDVQAEGVTGALRADTGSATFTGTGLRSATAHVTTEDGGVTLGFAAPPVSVLVSTGGWNATLSVPGGPYKVTTDGDASNDSISVPVSPDAARSINVSTDGGDLQIGPA